MNQFLKFSISFITITSLVSCKLSEKQSDYLKNKYFKKISLENIKELEKTQKNKKLQYTIDYDPEHIAEIIEFLNIPETYKFLTTTTLQFM